MQCDTISTTSGPRSEVIQRIIQRRKHNELRKRLPELENDPEFRSLRIEFFKASTMRERLLDRLKSRAKKLGILYYEHRDEVSVMVSCLVPKQTTKKLQQAADLYAMGKRKEASVLWEQIIKQYGLDKEPPQP